MASNSIQILIQAKDNASKTIRGVADVMDKGADKSGKFSNALAATGKAALRVGAIAGGALSAGLIAASKASFDQVKAVEEARFGLQAYEKDGAKVEKVLNGLVAYARSDMGVLFNRKDMFAAASTLKMYGNETDTLTERVKILSKGVAQGKTTFQELSAIVGRAAAKGRLDAVDFDMLIERGIGLDRSFRGSEVSANDLWKALNKALPDELLAGRAATIEGRMIRLQSAFREVGNAVLGVDADTNKFISGGLGDRFMVGVERATGVLRTVAPVVRDITSRFLAFTDTATPGLLAAGRAAGSYLGPAVRDLGRVISTDLVAAVRAFMSSDFVSYMGMTFVFALRSAIQAVTALVQAGSGLIQFLSQGGAALTGMAAGWAAYTIMQNGAVVATKAMAAAQGVLNAVMLANPVALLTAAVVGVGVAFWASTQASDRNRSSLDALAQAKRNAKVASDELRTAELSLEQANLRVERAQRTLAEAIRTFGRNSLEAREAQANLTQAQYDQANANTHLAAKTEINKQKQQELRAANAATEMSERLKKNAFASTTSEIGGQSSALTSLQQRLATLNGQKFSYTLEGVQVGPKPGEGKGYGVLKNAIGTIYSPGGQTLVGENGPELVNLPRGSQVTQAYRTRNELGQGEGAAASVLVNINGPVHFNDRSDIDYFAERISKTQRLARMGMAS